MCVPVQLCERVLGMAEQAKVCLCVRTWTKNRHVSLSSEGGVERWAHSHTVWSPSKHSCPYLFFSIWKLCSQARYKFTSSALQSQNLRCCVRKIVSSRLTWTAEGKQCSWLEGQPWSLVLHSHCIAVYHSPHSIPCSVQPWRPRKMNNRHYTGAAAWFPGGHESMLALLAWISNHVDEEPEKRESAAVLEDSVQPSRRSLWKRQGRQSSACPLGDGAEGKPWAETAQWQHACCVPLG